MDITDDGACFVCGKANPHGLRLDFSASDGQARASYIPDKAHQGYSGILHGGIVSALIDEAGVKAASSLGVTAVTVELRVRFRNPLMTGEPCVVEASVRPLRGRLLEGKASVKKTDGTTVAEGGLKLLGT